MKYRIFIEARKFVHDLGLKNKEEWKAYVKSGKKPDDIPADPYQLYKGKGWISMGDWLGTGYVATRNRRYRNFIESRKFVHSLEIKNIQEWKGYVKSGKKPKDIPADPYHWYKEKGWISMGDWLGTGSIAPQVREFLPFKEAREFAHTIKLTTQKEWQAYNRSGKKPDDIPADPYNAYKHREWKGWGDWLGTGTIASYNRQFKPFEKARKFVRKLGIRSRPQWYQYCKSGKRPLDIPTNPQNHYKKQWVNWGDWLGTFTVATHERKHMRFDDAKKYVAKLKITNSKDWRKFCQSDKKPVSLPANVSKVYESEWKGWGDFLGTGYVATQNREFRSFEQARKFVRGLKLKNEDEWNRFYKTDKRPSDIHANPRSYYKKEWISMGDWLGTGTVAPQKKQFLQFEEAREFVRSLHLKNTDEWDEYCKSGKKPDDIPGDPYDRYKKQWTDWPDWMGYEVSAWSLRRVKELLGELIRSKIIYEWDEAVLYSFLLRKGLLNISGNRHEAFFKNLIDASSSEQGRKAIEDYATSDSEIPPDLSGFTTVNVFKNPDEEIQSATSKELRSLW